MNIRIIGQQRENSFDQTQEKISVRDGKTKSIIFSRTSRGIPKFDAALRDDKNLVALLSQSSDSLSNRVMLGILPEGEPERKVRVGEINHKWSS